jgi:hypothetical protein
LRSYLTPQENSLPEPEMNNKIFSTGETRATNQSRFSDSGNEEHDLGIRVDEENELGI